MTTPGKLMKFVRSPQLTKIIIRWAQIIQFKYLQMFING